MKTFIVLVSIVAVALAVNVEFPFICGCKPAPPICASNYVTYAGICKMNCDHRYTNLYKLYDGICMYDAAVPARRRHQQQQALYQQQQELYEQQQQELYQQQQ